MDQKRYRALKKENDIILSHLTGQYQSTGCIFLKKARGYAIKNIDTEMKIKDVLEKMEDASFKQIPYHTFIPDENKFINDNIQNLSKQQKNHDQIKTIISVSILIICLVIWTVVSIWMRKPAKAMAVQEVKTELISDTEIKVSWEKNDFAANGYYIWMEDLNGKVLQGKFNVNDNQYIFKITENKEYIFCIQVKKTDYFDESEITKIEYQPSF